MQVEGREGGIGHNPRARGGCDSWRPDCGIKKIGGYFVLYEGDYFNLILGPDYFGVAFTLLLICLLTILLNRYIVASKRLAQGFWQVIIVGLAIGTSATFLSVALKDPGIVTRDRAPVPTCEEDMPYCDICSIYQPPRVIHCSTCDCCIMGLDHHCPWIGKCVGKGNMFFFKLFNVFWISYFAVFIYLILVS